MLEDNYLQSTLDTTEVYEKIFDTPFKKLLSSRVILAYLLKELLPEFEGIDDVQYIADNYLVEPILTTTKPLDKDITRPIKSIEQEDNSLTEGTIKYDICTKVNTPKHKKSKRKDKDTGEYKNLPVGLIINVEGQLSTNLDYYIPQRGIYYCSRLISSQKEDEFTGMNFQDLKKVYSIWICPCATGNMKNTITRYEINQVNSYGNYSIPKEDYQLLEVIIVGLDLKSEDRIDENVLDFLTTLFTDKLNSKEKLTTLINEYNIPVNSGIQKEIEYMNDEYRDFIDYLIDGFDLESYKKLRADSDRRKFIERIRDFIGKYKSKGWDIETIRDLTFDAYGDNDFGVTSEDIEEAFLFVEQEEKEQSNHLSFGKQ